MALGAFILNCYRVFNTDLSSIRSVYEMTILQATSSKIILSTELILLPFMIPLIYSDTYYSDVSNKVNLLILTRTKYKYYIWSKAIVIFIVSFFTVFFPLLLNQLLSFIPFPLYGYDNRFALPTYDIGIQNYDANAMFDLLRLTHPFLYNVLFSLFISIFAGLFSLLAFSVFLFLKKNKFVVFLTFFLAVVLFNLLISMVFSYRSSFTTLLTPGNTGSFYSLLVWLIFSVSMIFLCITAKIKKMTIE
ncbi:hypothetical protein [Paenibacillus bovis]|nr:hypothetical protein [Paenibacillus bovis]